MRARTKLLLAAALLCGVMLGAVGCSTQVESQSRAAVQQQAPQMEVSIRFAGQPADAPKPDAGHSVIFERGQTAFALGDYYQLLRTTDGGQSWQRLTPATPEDEKVFGGKFKDAVVAFSFHTSTRGWMNVFTSTRGLAQRGTWQTDDGGETWRFVSPDIFDGIYFADEQRGWTSRCGDGVGCRSYVTQDAGETWEPCGSIRSERQELDSVYFLTPQLAWGITRQSVDGEEVNGIARTTDGGCHWQQVWTNSDDPDERYNALHFLNEREGWLIGESRLYRTADGGKTWNAMPLPARGTQATDVYFADAKEGWIIAALAGEANEAVFHTTDGGRTWRQLTTSEIAGGKLPAQWEAGRLLQALY